MRYLLMGDPHANFDIISKFFAIAEKIKPDVLILNGDILDFWRYNSEYNRDVFFEIISYRYIFQLLIGKNVKIQYILGNHDFEMFLEIYKYPELMEYINIISDKYTFTSGEKKYLVMHGHQAEYDAYNLESSFWKKKWVKFYAFTLGKRFPKLADRAEEIALTLVGRLQHKEIDEKYKIFAEKIRQWQRVDVVVMGHTHRDYYSKSYINLGLKALVVENGKETFISI